MADFAEALGWLKTGKPVYRACWRENVFVFLEDHPIPRLTGQFAGLRGHGVNQAFCKLEGDGTISVGWLPQAVDLLAEDWLPVLRCKTLQDPRVWRYKVWRR